MLLVRYYYISGYLPSFCYPSHCIWGAVAPIYHKMKRQVEILRNSFYLFNTMTDRSEKDRSEHQSQNYNRNQKKNRVAKLLNLLLVFVRIMNVNGSNRNVDVG